MISTIHTPEEIRKLSIQAILNLSIEKLATIYNDAELAVIVDHRKIEMINELLKYVYLIGQRGYSIQYPPVRSGTITRIVGFSNDTIIVRFEYDNRQGFDNITLDNFNLIRL